MTYTIERTGPVWVGCCKVFSPCDCADDERSLRFESPDDPGLRAWRIRHGEDPDAPDPEPMLVTGFSVGLARLTTRDTT